MFSELQNFAGSAAEHPEVVKRNSGHTGPITEQGKAVSARNAIRHGMCAKTLILLHESEGDWLLLLNTWLDGYQNPAENTLLYTFVLKVAQAEWQRLRIQREYDYFQLTHGTPPIGAWQPHEIKNHDLVARYLTAAERRFQREYRMLEQHWKSHHKPAPEPQKPAKEPEQPKFSGEMPDIRFINNETGESCDCFGNDYPAPPNYVSEPIIPGVYRPNHPAYEPPASPTGRNGNHEAPASPTGRNGNHEGPPPKN
jgi:hypothetical protein